MSALDQYIKIISESIRNCKDEGLLDLIYRLLSAKG